MFEPDSFSRDVAANAVGGLVGASVVVVAAAFFGFGNDHRAAYLVVSGAIVVGGYLGVALLTLGLWETLKPPDRSYGVHRVTRGLLALLACATVAVILGLIYVAVIGSMGDFVKDITNYHPTSQPTSHPS